MASQALYLRWRPMTFEEVVGQEHVTYTLRNAINSGRLGHAYLFSGPRGTGKTTMARLLAKAVNCQHEDPAVRPCNQCTHCLAVNEGRFLDLIEIDAASHTGVDDVRDLRDRIAFAPNEGQYKVYIIDEVHRFSGAAFDALLKTIEEPPAHALFVLATTEIHKVPQTIKSRCQRFDFRRLSLGQIIERLRLILEHEGIQHDDAALELVARQATGSMRDAISLLDQLIAEPGEALTLDLARAILGTTGDESVHALVAALVSADIAYGLEIINQVVEQGADARQVANQVVSYLRLVMLAQTGGLALVELTTTPDEMAIIEDHAAHLPRRALLSTLNAFNRAAADMRSGWQPQLPLELAFIESAEALYASPPEAAASPPAPVAQGAAQTQQSPPATPPQASDESSGEPPEPPLEGAVALADVHARWPEVLKAARKMDLAVEALLKSGGLVGVEGQVIVYQMPTDLLRDKIEDETNRQIIEAALHQVFGLPLSIRGRVRAGSGSRRSSDADDLIANDSVISFVVNELGGSIKGIKPSEE